MCPFFNHFFYLNHAVRKANAPEILSDAEYLSDVEEGICAFLYCTDILSLFLLFHLSEN